MLRRGERRERWRGLARPWEQHAGAGITMSTISRFPSTAALCRGVLPEIPSLAFGSAPWQAGMESFNRGQARGEIATSIFWAAGNYLGYEECCSCCVSSFGCKVQIGEARQVDRHDICSVLDGLPHCLGISSVCGLSQPLCQDPHACTARFVAHDPLPYGGVLLLAFLMHPAPQPQTQHCCDATQCTFTFASWR